MWKTCLLCWDFSTKRNKSLSPPLWRVKWLNGMPTYFLSIADYRGLYCSKRSFTHLNTGLTRPASMWKEEKLDSTLSLSSFNQVCLGTRFGNRDTFLVINKTADSLFSLIVGNVLHPTSVGRNTWRKLFGDKGLLKPHCNTEGFNPVCFPILVRIGILFDDFSPCTQCGSWIVFGAGPSCSQLFAPPTATTYSFCMLWAGVYCG